MHVSFPTRVVLLPKRVAQLVRSAEDCTSIETFGSIGPTRAAQDTDREDPKSAPASISADGVEIPGTVTGSKVDGVAMGLPDACATICVTVVAR